MELPIYSIDSIDILVLMVTRKQLSLNMKYFQRIQTIMGQYSGVSWPSGLAYRTQVLVLATECGFESRP